MRRQSFTGQWPQKAGLSGTSIRMPDPPTLALALLFATSGVGHFVFADAYARAIPEWLPHRAFLVLISGVLELLGAVGLLIPALRVVVGWCLLALLVAVFPANIQILATVRAADGPIWIETLLWIRLPLQFLLIWLVYRYAVSPFVGRVCRTPPVLTRST